MALRRAIALITGKITVLPSVDTLEGCGDAYTIPNSGAPTRYEHSLLRRAFAQPITDGNGRVTIYLTNDNTANGTALFKEIWDIKGTGVYGGNDASLAPNFFVESVSTNLKVITLRYVRTTSILGIINVSFGAANIQAYVRVEGLPL